MRKPSHLYAFGGGNPDAVDVATTLNAKGAVGRMDFESETFVAIVIPIDMRQASRGATVAIVIPIDMRQASRGATMTNNRPENAVSGGSPGTGIGDPGDPSPSLANSHTPAVAYEVAHPLRAEGFDASEDGTGRGIPLVPVVAPCLTKNYGKQPDSSDTNAGPMLVAYGISGQINAAEEIMPTLLKPSQSGGGHPPAVAFSCKDYGADATDDLAPTLRAMPHNESHANAGGQMAVCFNLRGREDGAQPEVSDVASIRSASGGSSRSYAATEMAVRRLTVVECARLMGFEDTYLHIEYGRPRKIAADEAAYLSSHGLRVWQEGDQWMTGIAADGNMYRAYGNSKVTSVVRWLGERIEAADKRKRAVCP